MMLGVENSTVDGLTVDEWERRIGAQFRALRISEELDRESLARRASVSLGSIANLENGKGSSLRTLVRVAKALGRQQWLDAIFDVDAGPTPMEALRAARRAQQPRQRVSRKRES